MHGFQKEHGDEGAETVEFSLVVLVLFGLIFVMIAVAWVIFAKAAIQYAAREGVRYAVTNHSVGDIKTVVQQSSFGFLAGDPGLNNISVNYLTPDLKTTASNQGGNLVEISIGGVVIDPFGLRSFGLAPVTLSAESSDVMENSPPSTGT